MSAAGGAGAALPSAFPPILVTAPDLPARTPLPSDAFGCIVTGLLSRGRLCILASDARVARAMTPRQKRSRAEENMMLWRDDAVSGRRSDLAFNTCRDRAATASLGSL